MENDTSNKAPYDAMRALAVKATAHYFSITESYVRICLKKNRGDKTESIRNFYNQK